MIRKLIYPLLTLFLLACFDTTMNHGKISPIDGSKAQLLRVNLAGHSYSASVENFTQFVHQLSGKAPFLWSTHPIAEQVRLYLPDTTLFEDHYLFSQEIPYRDSFRILFYEFSPTTTARSKIYLASFQSNGMLIDLLPAQSLSQDGNLSVNLIDDEVLELEYADFYLSQAFFQSDRYRYEVSDSLKEAMQTTEHTALRHIARKHDFVETTFYENYRIEKNGQFRRLANQQEVNRKRKYPFTSTRIISYQELDRYNLRQLKMMRHEIYADHGYIFKSKKERRYFRKKKWYKAQHEQVDDLLNDIEQINLAKIQQVEMTYQ
ncbi:MAG: YARHG domain-containing protein [Bacteroidota bacterium]